MNLRHLLLLCSALWLAGCATTTTPNSTAPATRTSAASHIPQGPLTPLNSKNARSSQVASLAAPADLWERIRRGFAMPDLEQDLVQNHEQWYSSRPDYIQRMTERSSKYLFHIVEELERRDMPTELALLPYIESAFNPQAVSSAKAAGMWQFMPATGTYFDLKQNAFRDDRRDVLASTRAALDYLQKLHGMFGDWHLALAAYNWGEGSVGRAIKRNQALGLGTSYAELNMPAETRNYVPKLQAVKNIIARPETFSTELPLIENHPYFQAVDLNRDIDIALAAKLADVREEDFRALNPSLHKPVILAAGTPQILLPWDNANIFRRNLDAYDKGQFASWTVWVLPRTMSTADAAQRVGMSEYDLRNVNNIPPRMLIKSGSALMVPRTSAMDADVSGQVADTARIAFAPEVVTRRSTVKARKGDTIISLARRYNISSSEVVSWNDLRANTALRAGQSLVVYLPVRMSAAAAPSGGGSSKSAPTKAAPRNTGKSTVAQKGGTPSKRKR
ncbi:transglycosylase SLT domain-containing protein [Comamonas sp. GB3 AK4-5]|uniref:transglycosylase SLT domain-containing protein n=1 Tax=Comamonas sp. GB3 AK4-5 TaxID=3231487 RepID=UPI00351DDA68